MKNKGDKILVIDDQPANLEVLVSFLTDRNFNVRIAENGKWALQVLETYQPDIIILDVMMPEMDGFETCRRIKSNKDTADIPVIFMTALDSIQDKVTGFEAGGVDYITKPFQHVEVLARVNAHVALRKQKMKLEQQKELLKMMSITDDLTGLFNRRHMTTILEREFGRCQRYGTDLSCLLVDLDHFKRINDTYGHVFGDVVLREFSQSLARSIRATDSAFRYGGEEFLILLPQTDINGAIRIGENIRRRAENTQIEFRNISARVTLSGGISSFYQNHPRTSKEMITFSDTALYKSKKAGRNRMSVYG
ncbi:MAG: diguanylate cyclase [Thermodesulfobacteriota bacterium]|nr:diguanylate cyclase [Thermodesulfobacteriota bacterium]